MPFPDDDIKIVDVESYKTWISLNYGDNDFPCDDNSLGYYLIISQNYVLKTITQKWKMLCECAIFDDKKEQIPDSVKIAICMYAYDYIEIFYSETATQDSPHSSVEDNAFMYLSEKGYING